MLASAWVGGWRSFVEKLTVGPHDGLVDLVDHIGKATVSGIDGALVRVAVHHHIAAQQVYRCALSRDAYGGAGAILANASRHASPAAKKANPRLLKVKGAAKGKAKKKGSWELFYGYYEIP